MKPRNKQVAPLGLIVFAKPSYKQAAPLGLEGINLRCQVCIKISAPTGLIWHTCFFPWNQNKPALPDGYGTQAAYL